MTSHVEISSTSPTDFSQRDNEASHVDDVLFDMFRNETTDLLPVGKFLAVSEKQICADIFVFYLIFCFFVGFSQALRTAGIRMADPRIQEMMDNLKKVHRLSQYESGSPETQKLNRETFKW